MRSLHQASRWLRAIPLRAKFSALIVLSLLLMVLRPRVGSSHHQPQTSNTPQTHHMADALATFKYRSTCNISSLSLHSAFAPLCSDRVSLLTAISSGGRIGLDAPYIPRGCDMKWFSTTEICEILSRFDKVILVGDSMLRHVIGAINVLVREDLGYGAVTGWNFSKKEREECFCNDQFNVKTCSVQGVYKTADVQEHDPASLVCPLNSINIQIEQINKSPIPGDERNRFVHTLSHSKTRKPTAFILGHGLWSDLNHTVSIEWLDAVLNLIRSHPQSSSPPILFLPPNASGKNKPQEWEISQGNRALMLFEDMIVRECELRGVEVYGTWNMSIQATKYDGVHLDLRGNLVKAMGVLNWLAML